MARKRADEIRDAMGGWLHPDDDAGDTGAAAAVELDQAPALALYRRQGAPGELIALAPDGQAWRVPDQADGWTARVLVELDDARGLTRLGSAAERKALGRIGADVGQADRATGSTTSAGELQDLAAEGTPAPVSTIPAEPTPKGKAPGKVKAAAADAPGSGKAAGLNSQIVAYLTAAELAALVERAAADERSVSFVTRKAVRLYLGLE